MSYLYVSEQGASIVIEANVYHLLHELLRQVNRVRVSG